MPHVTIRCLSNNQCVQCPTPAIGAILLQTLGHERLILVSIQPLRGGQVYQCSRFVQPDGVYALDTYQEVHTPDRNILARIETQEDICLR